MVTKPATPHSETWGFEHAAFRDPLALSFLGDGGLPASEAFDFETYGPWWDLLAQHEITLLITREYENLLVSVGSSAGRPGVGYLRLPHPSGIAVRRDDSTVWVACTRNPNMLLELRPPAGLLEREGSVALVSDILVPHSATFLPGSLYLHDLAFVGDALLATATGHNSIVELMPGGGFRYVWWPKAVERDDAPMSTANHIQLNSIAAGPSVESSFYSATLEQPGTRRPGDTLLEVDGRGVLFDGRTREPIVRGLTRPHSARRWRDGVLVADSGHGRLVYAHDGELQTIVSLPGWTRGVAIVADEQAELAFVATSRIIPGFEAYAPGVQADTARCGVHCVDLRTGGVVAGIEWPAGFQIFGVEWLGTSLRALRLPEWPGAESPPGEDVLDLFSRFVPATALARRIPNESPTEEGTR